MKLSLFKKIILSLATIGIVAFGGHYLLENRSQSVPIEESSNLAVGATSAGLRVHSFTYTGNATDNRDLTGFPFAPTFATVKPSDTTANDGVMSWVGLGTDKSFDPFSGASAPFADGIQAWNSDGIQIGASDYVNKSGTTYYGFAIAGPASVYYEGSYTGDGTTSNPVTGVGFQPDFLIIRRNGGSAGRFYMSQINQSSVWTASNGSAGFTTMGSDGFTVTSASSQVNSTGQTYYFVALKLETGYSAMGTFTGNVTDNRAITGVGFPPEVLIMKASSGAQAPVFRTSAHSGDDTSIWITTTANATDRIQSLDSDGFTVGADNQVNRSATTMGWYALRDNPGSADSQGNFFLLFDNF